MAAGKGEIIAVSAPSGSGKTTIIKEVLKTFPDIVFSISATTRPKRDVESHGVEYYFISEDEFKKKIEKDEFIEWEKFYDYYYGTFKSSVENSINEGKSIILEVDVKGALSIKRLYPNAHLVYISPPSFDELVSRLKKRQTESEPDFKKRIERAEMELSHKDKFDYIIINNNLETAVKEAKSLIKKIITGEMNANKPG